MKNMSMIIIHAAGNATIGLGHLSRCRSLVLELQNLSAIDVHIIFETIPAIAAKFSNNIENLHIVEDRMSALRLRQNLTSEASANKAILVTDLLDLTPDDNVVARQQGFEQLVHLNDSGMPGYNPDIMIDCEAFEKEWIVGDGIQYYRGGKYHILRPEVLPYRLSTHWNKRTLQKVLVCFGGSDPGSFTEESLRYLTEVHTGLQFTFVIGPGFSPDRAGKIIESAKHFPKVSIERSPSDMGALIAGNDIVLTLGGLTAYEAMYIGVPAIGIAWGYMGFYAQKLDSAGLLMYAEDVTQAFQLLLNCCTNTDKIIRIARNGYECIDGKGGYRVAKILEKLLVAK